MNTIDATVEHSWTQIEDFTAAMKNAADKTDWEKVLTLATNRHEQLLAHFSHFPVSTDNADFYQPRLSILLQGERELQELTINTRREVLREGLANSNNHRAVSAYMNS